MYKLQKFTQPLYLSCC